MNCWWTFFVRYGYSYVSTPPCRRQREESAMALKCEFRTIFRVSSRYDGVAYSVDSYNDNAGGYIFHPVKTPCDPRYQMDRRDTARNRIFPGLYTSLLHYSSTYRPNKWQPSRNTISVNADWRRHSCRMPRKFARVLSVFRLRAPHVVPRTRLALNPFTIYSV